MFFLGGLDDMHSHGNGSKMASNGGGDSEAHLSEALLNPVQPAQITSQRDSNRRDRKEKHDVRSMGKDLSQDDFLFLLSMLEGELQARDEVITVLKAEMTDSALLEAHYGFRGPEKVLRALQRDSLQTKQDQLQDVYEEPMSELNRLVQTQRRSARQMLEQLVEVEHSHSSALCRLEEQERNHRAFIQKSDDLTTLLEQDRERLKFLIVKEKEYQERKEKESESKISALTEELTKLKTFALLVVSEQQCLSEKLGEQSRRVQELTTITDHTRQELSTAHTRAKEEELKALHLEAELHNQVSIYRQTQEAMTAKLAEEDAQNQQLRQRLVALSQQLDELEGTRGVLRKAEEELRELRDRLRRAEEVGERGMGTPSLLSEVEALRRRVEEMEGKDEELIRMGDQCRDLDHRLGRETSQCRSLKVEVDKLNSRISELDRLEEALGKSRQECSTLRGSLEREKGVSKMLSGELDTLKVRVKELEAIESQLEKNEMAMRQDLAKLRALTVALVENRKSMTERLQQAEEKLRGRGSKQNEPNTLSTITERVKEEGQQTLRSKADLEVRIKAIAKEKDELQARLKKEEERNGDLQSKVTIMKKRLQILESKKEKEEKKEKEMDIHNSLPNNSNHHCHEEDNKVKELSQEVDRLRRRLLEKEVVEGELMKAEEDFESLEKRFRDEQRRSQTLTEELEVAKRELSRYQQAEKQEVNQEHLLLCRLQQEQVKSRLLGREVEALKEKLQKLMGTEESISRVQMDHSTLQRKLIQQEAKNRGLAREMEGLTSELERYRRFSKSLRPGVNGRRFSDLHHCSKEVQTEPADCVPPDCTVNNRKLEESDEEDQNEDQVLNRSSSTLVNNLNSLNRVNNNVSQYSSHSANGTDMHQPVNGEVMMLTHTPGQPLHIKVTPDHGLNTATLEISSPTADSATSYTSTAVIPTSGAPPKQRITIIQNSAVSVVKNRSSPSSPDRALSPLTITPMSRMVSPSSSRSVTPDHNNSPIQIVTVRTCSPEPTEATGQAVFRKTPERQNSWHLQRSNSTNTSPSIITTEDNKIHIHLGSPYIQSLNGPQQVGPYHLRQEQRTQVLTNGCHVKGGGKITSSITITPATSPASHPSNITVSGLYD
uniref:Filamin A interacting protein 1 like n=1 Tax=Myripristis murdjan TaxID=586833 RepID=A0A667Z1L4_9TELE